MDVVSLWEIDISVALDRAPEATPMPAADALRFFLAFGFAIRPVGRANDLALVSLPRHHDAPFDRLLVAAALTEPYRLLTHDARLAAYGPIVTVV